MIIVVIGRAGSGKTTYSKEICKMTEMPLVEMSMIVQNLTEGSKASRGQINANTDQRAKSDPDWLWNPVHEALQQHNYHCVLSGIREPYLLHKIKVLKQETLVLGLEVSLFNRYSRLCFRDGFFSVKEFRNIDIGTKEEDGYVGDDELGIDITLTGCNVMIDGNKSLEEVRREIESLLIDRAVIRPRNVNVQFIKPR